MERGLTIAELERWKAFGASWRVLEASAECAVVDLCQCTGEPEERRQAYDPAVLDYLRRHPSSDA